MKRPHIQEKTALIWVWLSAIVVALDQLTKWYVVGNFQLYEILPVGPFLDLTRLHNEGAAFGILADAGGWQRWFFLGLAGAITLAILWWLRSLPARGHYWLVDRARADPRRRSRQRLRPLRGRLRRRLPALPLGRAFLPGIQRRRHRDHDRRDHADHRRAVRERAEKGGGAVKVLLANPRGFCAGVDRAIDIVERAIELFGAPIYVRHEVVHNKFVVDRLRGLGAVFVDELDAVPDGATVIFSAHGVPSAVENEAARRGLTVFDATCPLVTKVHMEVGKYARDGLDVILIGHAGHPEVEGTMGRFDAAHGGHIHLVETVADAEKISVRDPAKLAVVTQTTLSVDDTAKVMTALRERFPTLATPRKEDICYATQNRQDAVKQLVAQCDVIVVVGSQSSSNSNRLREIATTRGIPGYLVDGAEDLKPEWFEGKRAVGVTAGASAPESLVKEVVERLREWGGREAVEVVGREERVVFGLPQALRQVAKSESAGR